MTARIDGRTYEIPEYWLMGMAQRGYSVHDAVWHWHEQEQMEQAASRYRQELLSLGADNDSPENDTAPCKRA